MRKITRNILILIIILLIGSQLIRPDRTNPPIDPAQTFEAVAKPNAEVAAIVERSCYNCHSNTTVWPWYSNIAPVSWLLANDVSGGRSHMNFSEWGKLTPGKAQNKLENACEEVQGGDMPPWYYVLMHRNAKVSAQDVKTLCDAYRK